MPLSWSLVALVAYSSCFHSTDDRDRLYGIRGPVTNGFVLDVDYSLSIEETYLRFTRSFISHYQSLDIICFASLYDPVRTSMQQAQPQNRNIPRQQP
ncbi:hypothetical protein GGS24DRAFT_495971 [Hypoxylon argillaceum]|nr:hypothetical protein GGS24DRAFT_495971 [Hypoxylon argillaceum]